MGTLASSSSEIVESTEGLNSELKMKRTYSIEDEINRLFQAIEIRASKLDKDPLGKMKRPMRPSSGIGIGISEPVSLKQALRGLCISQASEMAAMKRISGFSEAGNIRRLYRAVVVEPNRSGEKNFVEISLVPDNLTPDSAVITTLPQSQAEIVLCQTSSEAEEIAKASAGDNKPVPLGLKSNDAEVNTSGGRISCRPSSKAEEIASTSASCKIIRKSGFMFRGKNNKPKTGIKSNTPKVNSCLSSLREQDKEIPDSETIITKLPQQETSSQTIEKSGFIFRGKKKNKPNPGLKSNCQKVNASSQSSNSTCTTSSTEESGSSGSGRGGNRRPHMSKDSRWGAIRCVQDQSGPLNLSHFKLIRRLGCGDIGTVYLAELAGTSCLFALKVMDNESLETRKKVSRAQTEREVMEMLDHPFLPTLFGHFVSEKLSCLVMEFCPGGDLHVLRQKQPTRTFSQQAARFYVAEVLVALEYLHMLGVVYRDLKPENVLVREDGHVMLSDFDLSLRAAPANPTVINPSPPPPPLVARPTKRTLAHPCAESGCIEPICLHPTWHISCFTPKKTRPALPIQVSLEPTAARSDSFVGTHEYLSPEIVRGEGHGSAVDWWTLGVFLFELLYGKTPFKGSADEDTLVNVVSKGLKFPETPMVSFEARDLIRGLLVKDPIGRFGSERGAAEIKRHPFFEGINWALIRCNAPPEVPNFVGESKELEVSPELVEFEVF